LRGEYTQALIACHVEVRCPSSPNIPIRPHSAAGTRTALDDGPAVVLALEDDLLSVAGGRASPRAGSVAVVAWWRRLRLLGGDEDGGAEDEDGGEKLHGRLVVVVGVCGECRCVNVGC